MPYCNFKEAHNAKHARDDWRTQSLLPERMPLCVKMLAVFLNILVIETRIRDFYPLARRQTSSPGGEGTQEIFTRGGSAPRLNPLPFYLPFLSEKEPLSYTSYCKKALSFLEDESITYHWKFFIVLRLLCKPFHRLQWQISLPFHILQPGAPDPYPFMECRSSRLHLGRFAYTI